MKGCTKVLILLSIIWMVGCGGNDNLEEVVIPPPFTPPQLLSPSINVGENSASFGFDKVQYVQNRQLSIEGIELDLKNKLLINITPIGDKFYVLLYDVIENVPSSRALASTNAGFELYVFDSQFYYIDNLFFDSSIDSIFQFFPIDDAVMLMSNAEIALLKGDQFVARYVVSESNTKIDMRVVKNRSTIDIFTYKRLSAFLKTNPEILAPEVQKVTFNTDLVIIDSQEQGGISVSSKAIDVNNNGFYHFYDNNFEGRVVWSSYYLAYYYYYAFRNGDEAAFDKLTVFMEHAANIPSSAYLTSMRYSYSREPQLFRLHLSRYINLLSFLSTELPELFYSKFPSHYLQNLNENLTIRNESFVEQATLINWQGVVCSTLQYRENSDFWANGINVPLNFISDYVTALVNADKHQKTTGNFAKATELLTCNLHFLEDFQKGPWDYWYMDGANGWSNTFSNIQSYSGFQSTFSADISYMSADAESFLTYCNYYTATEFDCESIRENIKDMILKGYLYPYLLRYYPGENAIVTYEYVSSPSDLYNHEFVKYRQNNQ